VRRSTRTTPTDIARTFPKGKACSRPTLTVTEVAHPLATAMGF
jgi:hypothetical protein